MRLAADVGSTRPTKVGASALTDRDRGSASLHGVGKHTLTHALDPSPVSQMGRTAGVDTVAAMPRGLIVADATTSPEAQQLTQTAFLAQLRDEVVVAAAAAAGPGWSPSSCPDIPRLFSHYAALDPASCERIMRRYSRLTSASRASDYIAPICARIQGALRRWARGDEVSWSIGASGVPVALERDGGADRATRGERESTLAVDELGPGAPIDSATASRMGGAFGDNFADVRIHTDGAAAAKTSELGADALAVGSHVAFGSGAYHPGTPSGDGLIAHELAHIIQQRGNEPLVQRRAVSVHASGAHEHDADDVASAVVSRLHAGRGPGDRPQEQHTPIRPSLTTALGVQRGNVSDQQREEWRAGDKFKEQMASTFLRCRRQHCTTPEAMDAAKADWDAAKTIDEATQILNLILEGHYSSGIAANSEGAIPACTAPPDEWKDFIALDMKQYEKVGVNDPVYARSVGPCVAIKFFAFGIIDGKRELLDCCAFHSGGTPVDDGAAAMSMAISFAKNELIGEVEILMMYREQIPIAKAHKDVIDKFKTTIAERRSSEWKPIVVHPTVETPVYGGGEFMDIELTGTGSDIRKRYARDNQQEMSPAAKPEGPPETSSGSVNDPMNPVDQLKQHTRHAFNLFVENRNQDDYAAACAERAWAAANTEAAVHEVIRQARNGEFLKPPALLAEFLRKARLDGVNGGKHQHARAAALADWKNARSQADVTECMRKAGEDYYRKTNKLSAF